MISSRVALLPASGLALAVAFALSTAALVALAAPGNPVVSPAPNTHTATLTSTVSITYDEPIDPTTVNHHSFAVHAMQSGLVQGAYDVQGGTVVLTPTHPFYAGELVYATATTGTLGLDGSAPLTPTVWQFQAGTVATRCIEGFVDIGADMVGVAMGTGEWGDYDGDGDLDVLLTGAGMYQTAWTLLYHNDGPGPDGEWSFTHGLELWGDDLQGVRDSDAAWGDYDGDGDLDLLLAGARSYDPPVSLIYRNDGAGAGGYWTFTDLAAGLVGVSDGTVAWADYDGDGDLDALVAGCTNTGRTARLYRNDEGTFVDVLVGLPGVCYAAAAWGDYDGDADLDLLLAGTLADGSSITRLYRNDGPVGGSGWTFTESGVALPGLGYTSLDWGDYDADGDLDLVMSGIDSQFDGVARVYRNDGALPGGGWTFTDVGLSLPGGGDALWADYDNDGNLDALVTGWQPDDTPVALLLHNQGAAAGWALYVHDLDINPLVAGSLSAGDYDGDGDVDLLHTGIDAITDPHALAWSVIYRNDDCAADLDVVKAVSPQHAAPGAVLTYTVAFSNTGSLPATGVVLTDVIPVTVTVHSVTSSGARITDTGASPGFVWQVQDLAQGEGGTIEIVGVADPVLPAGYAVDNTAEITTAVPDGNPADNRDSASFQLYNWQVTHTQPAAHDIAPVDTQLALTFNDDLDPASGSGETLAVHGSMGGLVAGALHYDAGARELTLSPGRVLHAGETVRATATSGLLNRDGERLLPTQWQFTAGRVAPRCTDGFVQETAVLPNVDSGALAWGDYDGDSDLDLFVGGGSKLYRNDGPSAAGTGWIFTPISTALPTFRYWSAVWGDYDADGDVDLLVTGLDGEVRLTLLYRNDGPAGSATWTFTYVDTGLDDLFGAADWGDYDNDGDLDLLIAGDTGIYDPASRIYRNDGPAAGGGWTFTDVHADIEDVWGYNGAAWGDYDGDGDLDVLLVGNDVAWHPVWRVYRNDLAPGGRAFVAVAGGATPYPANGAAWGDFDGDGDLDVLGSSGQIMRNDGPAAGQGWTFTVMDVDLMPGAVGIAMDWGDYDNDGDLDVAITGPWDERTSRLYRNDGPAGETGWTFTEIVDGFVDVQDGAVAWGDYDGDLDLDLALTGSSASGYVTRLYRNRDCAAADVSIGKTVSPAVASAGEEVTYVLSFANAPGTEIVPATGVVITDVVPPSLTVTSVLSAGVAITDVGTGAPYVWAVAPLAAGEGGVITMTAIAPASIVSGTFPNTAEIACDTPESFVTNNSASAMVQVVTWPVAGLSAWNDSPTALGHATTLTATVDAGSAVTYTWALGDGATGAGAVVTHTYPALGVYTAVVTAANRVSVLTATTTVTVEKPLADLHVAKRVRPRQVAPGGAVTYTITFSNAGPLPATGVVLTDVVPVTVTVTGVTTAGARITDTGASPAFVWQVQDLAPGEGGTIEIAGIADPSLPAGYLVANTAEITAAVRDVDPADNHAAAWFELYAWQVTGTAPTPNSIATVDTQLQLTFDGDLDPASASAETLAVHGSMGGLVSGTLSYDAVARRLTLTPGRGLHAGEMVRATATGGLLNTDGERLLPEQWQFTAGRVGPRCAAGFDAPGQPLVSELCDTLAWGDYDGDGDVDLLACGGHLLRNDGPPAGGGWWTFTPINTAFAWQELASAEWGDYDRDGDLDLLATASDAGVQTWLYRNDGAAGSDTWQFTSVGTELVNVQGDATWGDYDNDGDLDVLIAGDAGVAAPVSYVYRNDGPAAADGWTFTDIDAGLEGVWGELDGVAWGKYVGVAWGDYDGDGDLDALLGGTDAGSHTVWRVYRNDLAPGGRAFSLDAGGETVNGKVAWGDYDGDGDLDVLLGGDQVARNDGPGSDIGWIFTIVDLGLSSLREDRQAWADYDNDGDVDLLVVNDFLPPRLYRNDGPGSTGLILTQVPTELDEILGWGAAWGDLDGDLDLDLAVSGHLLPSGTPQALVYGNHDCAAADVAISKSVSPAVVTAGDTITYVLSFSNAPAAEILTATGVVITDVLPAGMEVTGVVSAGAVITNVGTGGQYVWHVEALSPGEGGVITLTVAASVPAGTAVNTATIGTGTVEQVVVNNAASASVLVVDLPLGGLSAANDSPTLLDTATTLTATTVTGTNPLFTWALGDGSVSVGATVTHTYPAPGVYTVVVTAANSLNVLTATTTVTVVEEAVVGLDAANDSPTRVGHATMLTATVDAGTRVTYTWALGDGEVGASAAVMHIYQVPGIYTAVVTAANNLNALTSTTTVTVQEAISGLVAVNDSPTVLGTTTMLTAVVAAGTDLTYIWALGDGAAGSGAVVTHTYGTAGVYTAVVTAANEVSVLTATTTVTVQEAVTGLAAWNDGPTALGQVTALTATVAAGDDITYTWALGDGSVGAGAILTHTYPAPGVYTAVVTAANSVSLLTATTAVTVQEAVAGLAAWNDGPTALGMPTALTATVTAGSHVTYTWAFGDGESGAGPVITHTYPAVGLYTAVVTAANSISALTATTTVVVEEAGAGLVATNDGPTALGAATTFTATADAGSALTYTWALGDGASGSGAIVTHTYGAPGVYTAVVTAANSVSVLTATTTALVQEAVAGLAAANDGPTALGQPTLLTATVDAGSDITYTWAPGDGSAAVGAMVTHTYPAPGVYAAVVTATNRVSALAAETTVVVEEEVAGLIAWNDSPTLLGGTTAFTATVDAGTDLTYTWAFGDMATGAGPTATHAYAGPGTYSAVVTASNRVSAISATTPVTVVESIVGLSVVSDSPTALDEATTFTATVAAGTEVTYTWHPGDGVPSARVVVIRAGEAFVVAHTYPAPGTYTATFTAANSVGSETARAVVAVEEAVAGLSAVSNSPVVLGTPAWLTATISAGTNITFTWALGDGTFGAGAVINHTYAAVGTYLAVVTAQNRVSVLTATVEVSVVEPARFVYLPLVIKGR